MTPLAPLTADATGPDSAWRSAPGLPVPQYLQSLYWWAYVHPRAVTLFEREWLVNAILFGNYSRLREAALTALAAPGGTHIGGRSLQLACVYGNLTQRLCQRLAPDARLDVVDVLPVQLRNLAAKLAPDARVALLHGDASALTCASASYDQVLLFFLLHEMPEAVRRATLAHALRVLKPGGRLVILDYHRPVPWHPLRPLMHLVFRHLEPHAFDLWRNDVEDFMPAHGQAVTLDKRLYFGGLYQQLTLTRPSTP